METRETKIQKLRDELEAEFCPPLDSSLFAAIFGDFEDAPEGLVVLRETLNALVAGIEVDVSEFPNGSAFDTNSDSQLLSANTSNSDALGSPLAFLRAAFPDFPIQVLQEALDNASSQQPTLHMEAIVEELLSSELLAQLDSEALDSENSPSGTKPERATAIPRKKGKAARKQESIILGDVRQRQLATKSSDRNQTEQVDPWTQLSSIAEYLSTLLRCSVPSLLSTFHSPDHPTAFHAVAAYLESMPPSKITEEEVDHLLISMSEMMANEEEEEEWDAQWARKCIHATNARLSDAIDLYEVLMKLEELGPIQHLPAPDQSPTTSVIPSPKPWSTTKIQAKIENRPRANKFKYPAPKPENKTDWQVVKKRVPKASPLHPHAEFIPSYRNFKAVPAWTVREATDDVQKNRAIEQSWYDKRAEALRKASQHWQRSQGGYGHQIAGYYAEEANKYLRESRVAAVEAARALVVRNRAQSKMMGYNTHNCVDLHGMKREEALVIVKEALVARAALKDASQREEPIRFITGKGNHSAGQKSVLLPALMNMFKSEGWTFREIEAGLVVYGKR